MKKGNFWTLLFALAMVGFSVNSHATTISTSGSGNLFGDDYSYLFTIEDTIDPTLYSATLTNTSPLTSGSQIDALAFNTTPDFTCCDSGDQLYINNISPDWTFTLSGMGILFDYVGDADPTAMNANRLASGESLTFDLNFLVAQSLDVFLNAESDLGQGFGAGSESGQVCVSFQSLGQGGEGSDGVCSNWDDTTQVPEPTSMALMGLGLVGLGLTRRKKKLS